MNIILPPTNSEDEKIVDELMFRAETERSISLINDDRNIKDEYKNLPIEDIKEDLKKKHLPFAILLETLKYDRNAGNSIRTANSFGATKIFHIGESRKINRKSAVGSYLYSDVIYLENMQNVLSLKKEYTFVALENNIGKSVSLFDFNWERVDNKPHLIIAGNEQNGISKELLDACDFFVEIPSRGSTRSINICSALACCMYDFSMKISMKNVI